MVEFSMLISLINFFKEMFRTGKSSQWIKPVLLSLLTEYMINALIGELNRKQEEVMMVLGWAEWTTGEADATYPMGRNQKLAKRQH